MKLPDLLAEPKYPKHVFEIMLEITTEDDGDGKYNSRRKSLRKFANTLFETKPEIQVGFYNDAHSDLMWGERFSRVVITFNTANKDNFAILVGWVTSLPEKHSACMAMSMECERCRS